MEPWKEFPEVWKTKAAFMNFMRGGIRRGLWNTHPVKLQFIKDHRVRVPLGKKTKNNPEGLIWGCQCELCKKQFKQSDCQVDHIEGNHKLQNMEDLLNFIEKMVIITYEDLQMICKDCHQIKSYADRYNITFEEAIIEKKVIEFAKKKAADQNQFLINIGASIDNIKNLARRKEVYREYLLNGNK